jgi:hypothetical protein
MNDEDRELMHSEIVTSLRNIDARLQKAERWQDNVERIFTEAECEELKQHVKDLCIIVKGDERLGLLPIRPIMVENKQFIDRVKWIISFLGLTTLAGVIALIIIIQKIAELIGSMP